MTRALDRWHFNFTIMSLNPSIVSAGVSTLGNVASGLIGATIGARKQYQYNSKLMAQQQQYALQNYETELRNNKALLDYQNAYNTPVAQMERLKAAGLNPNLVYGSLGDSASGSAQAPSIDSPQPGSMDNPYRDFNLGLSAGVASYWQAKQAQSNITQQTSVSGYNEALTRSITEKLTPEIEKLLAEKGYIKQQEKSSAWSTERSKRMFAYDRTAANLQNEKLVSEIMKTDAERDQLYNSIDVSLKQLQLNRKLTDGQLAQIKAAISKLSAETILYGAQKANQDFKNRMQEVIGRGETDDLIMSIQAASAIRGGDLDPQVIDRILQDARDRQHEKSGAASVVNRLGNWWLDRKDNRNFKSNLKR